jgi:glycosyltransferase involved in cell wall biosynthesis
MIKKYSKYSIRVLVFSFNHQDFILQTLQSINMQVCEYPVRITIHDDCSTDKSQEIIQSEMSNSPFEWELVVPSTNQLSKGINILNKLVFSTHEDFIATLEGDDYWTDPLKLQKQVDRLIADESANLCHHAFSVVKDEKVLYSWPPLHWRSDISGVELSKENFIGTLTVMFRRSAFIEKIPKNCRQLKIGDYHIWALLTQHSNILFINEVMSNYRLHDSNFFANLSKLDQLGFALQSKIFTACNVSANHFNLWFESIAIDLINLDDLKNSGLMFKDAQFEQELDSYIKELFSRKRKLRLLYLLLKKWRYFVYLKQKVKSELRIFLCRK